MAPRRNPAADVVAFFETAQIDAALTVLAICKGVVARRTPKSSTTKKSGRSSKRVDVTDLRGGPETPAPGAGEHS